jgi:adenine phosphoribosyltransferase
MDVTLIQSKIREIPDFPKPGILFKDITPLLGDAAAFAGAVDLLAEKVAARKPDVIVAIEARGFLFGAPLALKLGVGVAPIRKPNKLPWQKKRVEYTLEYGIDALEMHADALARGHRAVIIDDLLATGGTAGAAAKLVEDQGAKVASVAFLIELAALGGRAKLAPHEVDAVFTY